MDNIFKRLFDAKIPFSVGENNTKFLNFTGKEYFIISPTKFIKYTFVRSSEFKKYYIYELNAKETALFFSSEIQKKFKKIISNSDGKIWELIKNPLKITKEVAPPQLCPIPIPISIPIYSREFWIVKQEEVGYINVFGKPDDNRDHARLFNSLDGAINFITKYKKTHKGFTFTIEKL